MAALKLIRSRRPLFGLLVQSALGRFADYMAGVVYGWGVLQQTGSGFLAGLVIAAHLGALVVGTLFTGRLIARFGARTVAITGTWTSALAAAVVAALLLSGNTNAFIIAAVAAVGAILDGPSNIASETNYPEIARIARWNTLDLNAFDDGLDSTAALFAPAAGAGLIAAFGVNAAASVIAVLAFVSAVIVTLALPRFQNVAAKAVSLGPVLRFIRADRVLFPLAVLVSTVLGVFAALQLVALPIAVKQAGGQPSIMAAFLSAAAAGSILGALSTVPLRTRVTVAPVFAVAFLGLSLGAALLASGLEIWRVIVAGLVTGLPAGAVTPMAMTLVQLRPPRAMRADVMSIAGALVFAVAPVAILVTGAAADALTTGPVLMVMSGLLLVIAGVALAWLPRVRFDAPREDA